MEKTILIATTNEGKFKEFTTEFSDLPFKFISLKEAGLGNFELPEPYSTLWENAIHKAKFFGKKTKLPTIAEDTGFFVKSLNGEPGIKAKRYANSPEECQKKLLSALKGVPANKRQAYFETSACFYDPKFDNIFITKGKIDGFIIEKEVAKPSKGMTYDGLFYHPPSKKTMAEMSLADKNLISHRGQTINKLKLFLTKQYSFRQIVVSLGLIVKDRKMLLLKRRDFRPNYNNKWEFPGGGVENGETVEDCLKRECLEETGYTIKIEERLPEIFTASRLQTKGNYQIFLIFFIASIVKGKLSTSDSETGGTGWFTIKEALKLDLLPMNKKCIQDNKTILKKYID